MRNFTCLHPEQGEIERRIRRTPYDASIVVDFALIRNPETGRWSRYRKPVEVVSAGAIDDVLPGLRRIDEAVEQRGLVAVGFVSYEAAPAFDEAYRVHPLINGIPLLSFGLFEAPTQEPETFLEDLSSYAVGQWSASQDEEEYRRSVGRIHDHIALGDTYQVNHTFRLRASFDGDPRAFFLDLVRSQPDSFAAYLDMGGHVICSASPELFFQLDGEKLVSRPMKGTIDRGWDPRSDRARESWLGQSPKNRAENAMIVDMVRNDIGRIARVGSVDVTSSFDVERHPTVFQMTSTVEAKTAAPVSEIIAAVFPFASVTGAPKIRTMELINELETEPRGVYTGAIGVIEPGRRARFSVGIRTAVVDRLVGLVEYGAGSGVVWDSTADDEYRECVLKARILSQPAPDFDLLETIRWEPEGGFSLLDRHLDRLSGAAEYFGRPVDREAILDDLRKVPGPQFRSNCGTSDPAPRPPLRIRLLVAADGAHRIEESLLGARETRALQQHRAFCSAGVSPATFPLISKPPNSGLAREDQLSAVGEAPDRPVRLGLAHKVVQPDDPFLHFKTTNRTVYDEARRSRPDCDDVLLWNEKGEVTESTIANVVARIDGELVTPPVDCGLLAGTFRAELIERGEIVERVISVDELAQVEALYLINSVQGWRDVEWKDK